jgi:O-antigen ligase
MPPKVAALIIIPFIAYLFWRELRNPQSAKISWVPFAWIFIAGSRFPSRWLSLTAPIEVDGYIEGSPFDRNFFVALIILGMFVLLRRRIAWGQLFQKNKFLIAYLLYCLCSMLWTDSPFVLFKRWIKDLGNPIMALILLTEQRPWQAITTTFGRLSFVFVPLSLLFIKYYPDLGRYYTRGGYGTFTGIADGKNTLGLSCVLIAICFLWTLLYDREARTRFRHWSYLILIGVLVWLINIADSQTALMCLTVAGVLMLLSTRPAIAKQPTRLIGITLLIAIVYMVGDATFDLRDHMLSWLGRDATLTNRTKIWEIVGSQGTNPIVGVGFMSFWEGERIRTIGEGVGAFGLNQAHNGYLEQYVNLGYVGVAFIIGLAFVSLVNIRRQLSTDYTAAILRFSILIIALLYNYTEASFYGINNMWLLFVAAAIDPPPVRRAAVTAAVQRTQTTDRTAPAAAVAAVPQAARWRTRRAGTAAAPMRSTMRTRPFTR